MSWERLRSQPSLMCLHAAAIDFGGRLVLFPNARRAGKSLLTANLARLGHAVFTDDFVPLHVDPESRVISGMANGIAPRLRLPLPEELDADAASWIMDRITTRNKRYGYLTEIDLPQSGSLMPVGAVVLLDRDMERTVPAALEPVTPDEAMAAIVTQNFGRQVHSGAILKVTQAITHGVPVLRLRYRDVAEAADLLSRDARLNDLPQAKMPDDAVAMPDRSAPLDLAPVTASAQPMAQTYARIAGYTEIETDQAVYLADASGVAIHRLNPTSAVIWTLLESPMTGADVVEILQEVYPAVAAQQLQRDAGAALRFLEKRHLIRTV